MAKVICWSSLVPEREEMGFTVLPDLLPGLLMMIGN